jgi:hypothetical protein
MSRGILAPVLAVLCFATTIVSPLMDAGERDAGPVFESHHDPAVCPHGHDHSLCTQVNANAGVTTARVRHGLTASPLWYVRLLPSVRMASPAPHILPLGSRAPPLA